MTSPLGITIILATGALVCCVVFFFAGGWDTTLGFVASIAAAFFGLGAIFIPTVFYVSRHMGRISCATFAAQTNRPTKFVFYNSWSTGDCLTRTAGGKWIPTSNLREFGDKP